MKKELPEDLASAKCTSVPKDPLNQKADKRVL
jgi:hypothetical protein